MIPECPKGARVRAVVYWGGIRGYTPYTNLQGFFGKRILTSVIINKQGTFRPFATPLCVYPPPFLAIHHWVRASHIFLCLSNWKQNKIRHEWCHSFGRYNNHHWQNAENLSWLFLPCDAMLARGICYSPVSVTSRCSSKIAKHRIMQTKPHDSPETLVFWCQRSYGNSNGFTTLVEWVKILTHPTF